MAPGKTVDFIAPPYGAAERKAVEDVMWGSQLADGAKKSEFEAAFAKYIGVEYALAVNSGTSALELALLGAVATGHLKTGDSIIVPSFTFVAVANAVTNAGMIPVFVDVNEATKCMDPQWRPSSGHIEFEQNITGIIPVHTFGQTCDMNIIMQFAEEHDLFVIEDCCEAAGAEWYHQKVGSFGNAAVFSFTPTKNMTTGEGGMVVTNDLDLATAMKLLSANGIWTHLSTPLRRECVVAGHNYRMSEIQAAIGLVQLAKLDDMNATRRTLAVELSKAINERNIDVKTPPQRPDSTHSYQLYTIVLGEKLAYKRDQIVYYLHRAAIEAKVYFDYPIHKQRVYEVHKAIGELSITESLAQRVISLPMHPQLSKDDIWHMVNELVKAVQK